MHIYIIYKYYLQQFTYLGIHLIHFLNSNCREENCKIKIDGVNNVNHPSSLESLTEGFDPDLLFTTNSAFIGKKSNSADHQLSSLKQNKNIKNENKEAKYTQFMYEITQEIMENGLYTDKDLQNVFKKHIERNSGILDKVI